MRDTPMISFQQLSYTYPDAPHPTLHNVTLDIAEGNFALVVGPSGVGKSTLLRCINGLVPHFSGGTVAGLLRVNGLDPVQAAPRMMSRHVGFVFQDPEAQFVMDQVEDEIAFALENMAVPRQEMRVRIEEVLDVLDLAPLRSRRLETLSGGERQRVAIAAALALRPRVLVLDEPTSQLDPKSAEDVLHALTRLNSDLGLTIVLAEHRLERVLPFADMLVYLSPDGPDGAGVLAGVPREILPHLELLPPLVALGQALGWEPLPLTIKEGVRFARKEIIPDSPPAPSHPQPPAHSHASETLALPGGALEREPPTHPFLQVRGLEVDYNGQPVLRGVDLVVSSGEIVVVMGRNGSGKTTLLKTIVGLVRPRHGQVQVDGRNVAGREVAQICQQVGFLPQDPNSLLFADTVRDELLITLRNHGRAADESAIQALLERLGLHDKASRYPRDLSTGERQRVALGAIAITHPDALLLDEPTRGLDYRARQRLIDLLREWRNEGMAIVVVTHDVELAAALAERVVLMSQGEVIASGAPGQVMGASPLFAPQVARLFPGTGWLTPDVALAHLGKRV
jgi:energy-coupling factor transport system ATP-binding protein